MNKKIDILHIYAGTRGASGLYLDEIYRALKGNYTQEVIVSAFYSFPYGKKWFYRYSDISSIGLNILKINIVRKTLRFFELFITLIRILIYVKFSNVRFVNYGLTSDLVVEYLFIRLLKFNSKVEVIITCHDVVPFGSDDADILSKKIKRKKLFFDLADYLLIHNENSKKDLKRYYNIVEKTLPVLCFPLMDLNNLNSKPTEISLIRDKSKFTIGMLGNLRQEKGVDVLLKAWNKFYEPSKNIQLIIAGYIPHNIDYGFDKFKNKSVLIYDKFIEDSEFKSLIEECDVVVLPYTRGTNSGIPSQVTSSGTLVLTSNIPMFRNNRIISSEFLFESEDYKDLSSKLEEISSMDKYTIQCYNDKNSILLLRYKKTFSENILLVFNKLLSGPNL
jgi:glycosyltransferase involved in cell wall biosynthesis